jgi:hypothetical protein
MSRVPAWARNSENGPTVVEASSGAQAKLDHAAALERLHTRATGPLPLDRDRAAAEQNEETRVLRASRPKGRRWRALVRLDDQLDELQHRYAGALERVAEAERALANAPGVDANTLAHWLAADEKGPRPEATLPEAERTLAACRLLVDATLVEIDRKLAERVEYVQHNRDRMVDDARRDRQHAAGRLQRAIAELSEARQAMVDAVSVETWALSYPDPEANPARLRCELMLGGRISQAVPDIRTITAAGAVVAWLADDTDWLNQVVDAEQAKRDQPDDVRDSAVWLQTAAGQEALERERLRVLEASLPRNTREAGWGD